jgi:FlaA1/EpsC-like NDP-sugar epimerase
MGFPLSNPLYYSTCYFTCISRDVSTFAFLGHVFVFCSLLNIIFFKVVVFSLILFSFFQTYTNNVFFKVTIFLFFTLLLLFLSTLSLLFLLTNETSPWAESYLRVKVFLISCGNRIAYLLPSPQKSATLPVLNQPNPFSVFPS